MKNAWIIHFKIQPKFTVDNIPSKGNNATGMREVMANGNTEVIQ